MKPTPPVRETQLLIKCAKPNLHQCQYILIVHRGPFRIWQCKAKAHSLCMMSPCPPVRPRPRLLLFHHPMWRPWRKNQARRSRNELWPVRWPLAWPDREWLTKKTRKKKKMRRGDAMERDRWKTRGNVQGKKQNNGGKQS